MKRMVKYHGRLLIDGEKKGRTSVEAAIDRFMEENEKDEESDDDPLHGSEHAQSVSEPYTLNHASTCGDEDDIYEVLEQEVEEELHEEGFQEQLDDSWLTVPIYESSEITVGEAVEEILDYYFRNSLTKKSLAELLTILSFLLPKPNNIPKTNYALSKLLKSIIPMRTKIIRKHRFCETCSLYLGEWTTSVAQCDACESTEVNGMFVEYDLRTRLVDAFEVRKLDKFMDENRETISLSNRDYIYDITDGSAFKKLKEEAIPGNYDISLLWNTDGMPTAHSSNGQMWAIQAQIMNIPPNNRRSFQFVCGIYYSRASKPDMNSFLHPFTTAMKDLYTNGVSWYQKTSGLQINSKVIAPVATLDCPARAAVQNLMQYNGMYGCSFCEHPGETCRAGAGISHVYPPLNEDPPLRTNATMYIQASAAVQAGTQSVKGVKGPSIVATMPFFDMAEGFVPDYMHCILLGVSRMILSCWCDTKNKDQPFYIKKSSRDEIDRLLIEIKPPDFVTRAPRGLKYRHFWKASELRAFLLFYAVILLQSILLERYYQHFLLLVRATQILLQSRIHRLEIDLAEHLLHVFILEIGELYGRAKYTFNVHQLSHLTRYVRLWGPLWAWSAFPFEDGNGYILKIAHGPNKLDVEIFNTFQFIDALNILKYKLPMSTRKNDPIRALGLPMQKCLDDTEITALRNLLVLDATALRNLVVYARIEIGRNIFTSEMYNRQTKRNNCSIFWKNGDALGHIKFFVMIDTHLLAIVQKFVVKTDGKDSIVHKNTNMNFDSCIKPVRRTYCIEALPVEAIDGKFLNIRRGTCNYACIFPNDVERK